jgi:hypothetical protein
MLDQSLRIQRVRRLAPADLCWSHFRDRETPPPVVPAEAFAVTTRHVDPPTPAADRPAKPADRSEGDQATLPAPFQDQEHPARKRLRSTQFPLTAGAVRLCRRPTSETSIHRQTVSQGTQSPLDQLPMLRRSTWPRLFPPVSAHLPDRHKPPPGQRATKRFATANSWHMNTVFRRVGSPARRKFFGFNRTPVMYVPGVMKLTPQIDYVNPRWSFLPIPVNPPIFLSFPVLPASVLTGSRCGFATRHTCHCGEYRHCRRRNDRAGLLISVTANKEWEAQITTFTVIAAGYPDIAGRNIEVFS